MARLLEATKAQNYAALGRLMGLSTSAYSNRKKAGSIPFEEIVTLATSYDLNLNWLFFGEQPIAQSQVQTLVREVDSSLLGRILMAMRAAIFRNSNQVPDKQALEDAARIGLLAGWLYNKVANIDGEKAQMRAVNEEAESLAHVAGVIEGDRLEAIKANWLAPAKGRQSK